jgi:hypothetical protein
MGRASDDMKVRELRVKGENDAADAQALWNQQVIEFQKAVASGMDMELLTRLGELQAAERERLAQTQAAAKAAAAAAAAEAELTKARTQAAASQDLAVEMLNAQGKTTEADQMAFDLAQQRRMEDAQKNQSADYVAKLAELQALERQNRAAAASGAGTSVGIEASTASNVYAGADTVTTNFSSKVSAEVGDRMLDNLVSMRIILRAIEVNTRNIGGRLNNALGLSLSDNRSLLGSAVLS